jgi:toxin ParE1/3/4
MSPTRLEIHPQAAAEARAARAWYAERSASIAAKFIAELDRAIEQVTTSPKQWPTYLHGTRVYQLPRFPYLMVFLELDDTVQIVAVAHGKRRPGYWKKRLG